jgi:pimeloyl-ACP methyl ester carboxylesterase
MSNEVGAQNWDDIFFTARDGLRLYARHYAAPVGARRRPALCLPGLTRNSRDFHTLATYLSSSDNPAARDVWAVDYRGRGRSAYDPDWRNYALQIELLDVLDLMTLTGLHDTAIIGTSRGGLLAMIMGSARPASIGAVVLNDIGPRIERDGLLRIMAYVGRVPLPTTWAEATALVRDMNAREFPAVPARDWEAIARQWFNDDHDRPTQGYDQSLAKALSDLAGPVPELWPQFDSLARIPTMVIRGAKSDILSETTVADMVQHHPDLQTLIVNGQGHAPMLRDLPTMAAISNFLVTSDPPVSVSSEIAAALVRR